MSKSHVSLYVNPIFVETSTLRENQSHHKGKPFCQNRQNHQSEYIHSPYGFNGMGYIKDETFHFDVIFPILCNDSGQLSDELFLQYLLKQGCNYRRPIITMMAESIYQRCMNRKKITEREWINHTQKLLNNNEKLFESEEQKYLLKVMKDFCVDKLIELLDSDTTFPYLTSSYPKEQLQSIYQPLSEVHIIIFIRILLIETDLWGVSQPSIFQRNYNSFSFLLTQQLRYHFPTQKNTKKNTL